MTELTAARTSKTAVLTLALGVASLGLLVATGVPAIYFGMQAIREVNSSDGRLRGLRLAITGFVLGIATSFVTIVGVVFMLLFFAQEKNHLAGCTNNLRLIGQAAARYRDHHDDYYPAGTVANEALPPDRRLSWQAALLPFLTEGRAADKKQGKPGHWDQLSEQIDFHAAWDAPTHAGLRQNVSPYLCPSFLYMQSSGQVGLTSYVGMAGIGLDAPTLPLKDPRCGFFGYDRHIKQTDITAGASETMMVVETTQDNGAWMAGGPATVRGLDPDGERYVGWGRPFGGLHREGMNVLWADGSVRVVTVSIDEILFRDTALIARTGLE